MLQKYIFIRSDNRYDIQISKNTNEIDNTDYFLFKKNNADTDFYYLKREQKIRNVINFQLPHTAFSKSCEITKICRLNYQKEIIASYEIISKIPQNIDLNSKDLTPNIPCFDITSDFNYKIFAHTSDLIIFKGDGIKHTFKAQYSLLTYFKKNYYCKFFDKNSKVLVLGSTELFIKIMKLKLYYRRKKKC